MQRQELYNPERDRGKREYGATNVGEYSGRPLFLLILPIGEEERHSIGFWISD
jgi:hypothetical protein